MALGDPIEHLFVEHLFGSLSVRVTQSDGAATGSDISRPVVTMGAR
jgi:hypothetical protein